MLITQKCLLFPPSSQHLRHETAVLRGWEGRGRRWRRGWGFGEGVQWGREGVELWLDQGQGGASKSLPSLPPEYPLFGMFKYGNPKLALLKSRMLVADLFLFLLPFSLN